MIVTKPCPVLSLGSGKLLHLFSETYALFGTCRKHKNLLEQTEGHKKVLNMSVTVLMVLVELRLYVT